MKRFDRDPGELKTLEKKLYQAVLALETADECRRFFSDLCTPSEIEAMADRWNIVGKLVKRESYRDISTSTGDSLATIVRVARSLYSKDKGYQLVLQKQGEWKND